MTSLNNELPVELRREVLDAILCGLRVGHRTASETHQPDLGFDGFTYGTIAWRVSTRWIGDEINLVPGASAREINNSLRIFADGVAISVYAGGHDLDWDPNTFDFERGTPTRRSIPRRNTLNIQLTFDDLDDPVLQEPGVFEELTVVHCGNPQDELVAAYIGAAVYDKDLGRSRWAWIRPIFRFDTVVSPIGSDAPHYTAHDEIDLPEVPLELRDEEPGKDAEGDV